MEKKKIKKLVGHIICFHLSEKRKKLQSGFYTGKICKATLDNNDKIIIIVKTLNSITKDYTGMEVELLEKEWSKPWCGLEINKKQISVYDYLN